MNTLKLSTLLISMLPLSSGCLPGVLRQRLLECGAARETVLPRQALFECEGLWVGNALRGLIPAVREEGR